MATAQCQSCAAVQGPVHAMAMAACRLFRYMTEVKGAVDPGTIVSALQQTAVITSQKPQSGAVQSAW